jgi:hypothetical protein
MGFATDLNFYSVKSLRGGARCAFFLPLLTRLVMQTRLLVRAEMVRISIGLTNKMQIDSSGPCAILLGCLVGKSPPLMFILKPICLCISAVSSLSARSIQSKRSKCSYRPEGWTSKSQPQKKVFSKPIHLTFVPRISSSPFRSHEFKVGRSVEALPRSKNLWYRFLVHTASSNTDKRDNKAAIGSMFNIRKSYANTFDCIICCKNIKEQ